jgi:hypothetical protein
MLCRVRGQLVEEGLEAVLSRKQPETPAVSRIFDREKEAKLIALACSKPPKGRTVSAAIQESGLPSRPLGGGRGRRVAPPLEMPVTLCN